MTPSRRSLVVFVVGVSTGFFVTYLILSVTHLNLGRPNAPRNNDLFLLPNSPHSTGQTDRFSGPDQEQSWDDFHADNHRDEDTVAHEMAKRVRILCWVMTSPGNIQNKARHVKATWGRRCNKLLFMSSEEESSLPAVGLSVSEGRDHLWAKTKEAFRYVYKHHLDEADWFLKADDDTYVVLENLRLLVHQYNPQKPIYFGRRFKQHVRQGYMSGGAGYVLSKEAVRRLVIHGLDVPNVCREDDGGAEDVEIGRCLQHVGVNIVDSRDALGRETFHPFTPLHHLIPGVVPRDNWYWSYNYYPAKEGPGCCSDFTITFHYVPPNMMYTMEYFIYHLKPFGVQSKIALPSEKYRPEANTPHKLPAKMKSDELAKGSVKPVVGLHVEPKMAAESESEKVKGESKAERATPHIKDAEEENRHRDKLVVMQR